MCRPVVERSRDQTWKARKHGCEDVTSQDELSERKEEERSGGNVGTTVRQKCRGHVWVMNVTEKKRVTGEQEMKSELVTWRQEEGRKG
jgi:hypothetical protein